MQKIEQSFQKGLQSLEDINILGGQELSPLVGKASHHFAELKRKALESIDEGQKFEKLNSFLANHLENVFHNFIKNSTHITQAQIYFNDLSWGNKEWNSIISIIPEMLHILTLLKVQKNIQLVQQEETFILRGWVDHNYSIETSRPDIYSVFRRLLTHKVLMSYQIITGSREHESIIEIKFDLSHDDNKAYSLVLSENEGELKNNFSQKIQFSNVFKNYELNDRNDFPEYKHNILLIDKGFNLKKEDAAISDILSKDVEEGLNSQVIHFPFLFQPISFLLPKSGSIEMREGDENIYMDIFQMILHSK